MANKTVKYDISCTAWVKIASASESVYTEPLKKLVKYWVRFLDTDDTAPTSDIDGDYDFRLFKENSDCDTLSLPSSGDIYCRSKDVDGELKVLS